MYQYNDMRCTFYEPILFSLNRCQFEACETDKQCRSYDFNLRFTTANFAESRYNHFSNFMRVI